MGEGDGNRAHQWERRLAGRVSGVDAEVMAFDMHLCRTLAPMSEERQEGLLDTAICSTEIDNFPSRYYSHNSMVPLVGAHESGV